jgi:hypothetical protein
MIFDQLHENDTLQKQLSNFTSLIPKINSHFGLAGFRPISLWVPL